MGAGTTGGFPRGRLFRKGFEKLLGCEIKTPRAFTYPSKKPGVVIACVTPRVLRAYESLRDGLACGVPRTSRLVLFFLLTMQHYYSIVTFMEAAMTPSILKNVVRMPKQRSEAGQKPHLLSIERTTGAFPSGCQGIRAARTRDVSLCCGTRRTGTRDCQPAA